MSNKNKLIGLSLIALATLCACNDDNHADGKGNRLVTFSVNAKANGGWSDINGSRSAWMSPQAQQMGEPVEMEGKLNGKPVYLTSEVTEGFPTDNPTFTRGTQITDADGMSSFGVTAFLGSQKYMDHVEIKKSADSWKPQTDYFWLNGKSLDFYAWYPYNPAEGSHGIPSGMTLTQEDFSSISYTVPKDVSKQEDLMFAVKKNASEPADGNATSLDFKHSLAAVKFVVGDLPTGTKVTSVALKGVKYKGDLAVTAGNNGEAQLAWSNLATDTENFTQATDKKVKENDTDNAITKADQTFFMMPQTLPDDAEVEVNLEDEKGAPSKINAKLLDATGEWKAGNTYTYRINSSGVTIKVNFFEGINGTDGQPYTSHNISANGDPVNIHLTYPTTTEKITARMAYETTVTGGKDYEVFMDNIDLTGLKEWSGSSPRMNNIGDPTNAKGTPTPFVIQIKIKSSAPLKMPSDPSTPNKETVYQPTTDDEKWYTIWRGTMYPPNYIQDKLKNGNPNWCDEYIIVARKDGKSGPYNETESHEWWEVDEKHPLYGKGRWCIINPPWGWQLRRVYWMYILTQNGEYPGGSSLYGDRLISEKNQHPDSPGNYLYWIARAPINNLSNCYCIMGHGRAWAEMGGYIGGFQVFEVSKQTLRHYRYCIEKVSL